MVICVMPVSFMDRFVSSPFVIFRVTLPMPVIVELITRIASIVVFSISPPVCSSLRCIGKLGTRSSQVLCPPQILSIRYTSWSDGVAIVFILIDGPQRINRIPSRCIVRRYMVLYSVTVQTEKNCYDNFEIEASSYSEAWVKGAKAGNSPIVIRIREVKI